MKISSLQLRILDLVRNINQRRLILGLALVIGLLSGIAAILLKNLTHFVEDKSRTWLLGDHSSDLSFCFPWWESR